MREIKYITRKELKELFSAINNTRDLIMFKLMYYYGLRRQEASNLVVSDIIIDDSAIRINAVKNGDKGLHLLLPRTLSMLIDYIEEYKLSKDSPLFRSKKGGQLSTTQIFRLFRKYADKAGLDKSLQHPHVLRHTIAVHLADSGRTAEEVKMHLRHKSITSTMVYFQFTNERRKKIQEEMLSSLI